MTNHDHDQVQAQRLECSDIDLEISKLAQVCCIRAELGDSLGETAEGERIYHRDSSIANILDTFGIEESAISILLLHRMINSLVACKRE